MFLLIKVILSFKVNSVYIYINITNPLILLFFTDIMCTQIDVIAKQNDRIFLIGYKWHLIKRVIYTNPEMSEHHHSEPKPVTSHMNMQSWISHALSKYSES